jgi:hypothetical protein
VIPIEEKPNKPKDKFIVNTMMNSSGLNHTQDVSVHLNMTQEVKAAGGGVIGGLTVEDLLNRTANQ